MYQVADSEVIARGGRALLRRRAATHVSRTVILLGLVSMLTDISSEMVNTILPIYLVFTLGMTPLQFGVIDGIQQGAAALVRVVSGFTADRLGRYKEVAVFGYGLSAFCRIGFLLVGRSWTLIGTVVFLDRTGKGIRTAPRDALISLSTPKEELGTAFGVHRALDTAGAMIGPLLAFGLLVLAPHNFQPIFVVSFCFGLVGLGILVLFVENRPERVEEPKPEPINVKAVGKLLALPGFSAVLAAGGLLAVATMSDGFIYLGLQHKLGFAGRDLPLLYVATSLFYMLLAVPMGKLADRVGRGCVFVGGYALLLVVYAALLLPPLGALGTILVLLSFGAYYAATDGVLMALSSALLPAGVRATALSVVVTVTNLGRLLASVAFGAAWTLLGLQTAVIIFAISLGLAAIGAAFILTRRSWQPADA
jgi:MFS family permease